MDINLPTEQDATTAQAAIEALRDMRSLSSHMTIRFGAKDAADEVEVEVPGEAVHLLVRILGYIASGSAVSVVPVQAELTTQQAADLLGVSRPYLVRLLEEGELPFHKVGTHRRVRAADVLDYKARRHIRARRVLDELTQEAQDLGLGY